MYNIEMSSKATQYRKEHPEYYAQERERERERMKKVYQENTEYRERAKQQALARYYKKKEQNSNAFLVVS